MSEKLQAQVISGLKWTFLLRALAQVFTWLSTIIVIRFLSPEDYGLKALVGIAFSLFIVLSTVAIESIIIRNKDIEQDGVASIFGVSIILNIALFIISLLIAPLIADYYQQEILQTVMIVMSFAFIIMPFKSVPFALLARRMEFKKRSLIDLFSAVVSSLICLGLAYNGAGVWALVVGQLSMIIFQILLYLYYVNWICIPSFSVPYFRKVFEYGSGVLISALVWMMCWRLDVFIGGKFLSLEQIGAFAVALHLASLPTEKVMPLLNQIAFPAFSKLQDSEKELKYYFKKSSRLVFSVLFPMCVILSLTSEYLVSLIFTDKWENLAVPLSVLALAVPFKALITMYVPIYNAVGKPKVSMTNGIISSVIFSVSIFVGVQFGLLGLCFSWLVAAPITYLFIHYQYSKIFSSDFFQGVNFILLPSVIGLIFFYFYDWVVNNIFVGVIEGFLLFLVTILSVCVVYLLSYALFDKPSFNELQSFSRRMVK